MEHCSILNLSITESLFTVKRRLITFLWAHFNSRFDPLNSCTYHRVVTVILLQDFNCKIFITACFPCFHLLLLLLLLVFCCVVHCFLLVMYLVKLCNHSTTVDHASCPPCCLYSLHHALIFLYTPDNVGRWASINADTNQTHDIGMVKLFHLYTFLHDFVDFILIKEPYIALQI